MPTRMLQLRPRTKLFLSTDKVEGAFGRGKWRLLKAVEEKGSIQQAAVSLGRSYRKAWGDIKRAEEGLGRKLVLRYRGGAHGGRTELTEFGERLLAAWEKYECSVDKAVDNAFATHLKRLLRNRDDRL